MDIDHLLGISHFTGEGYQPLVDYESWRVAVLRYIDELQPEKIDLVECHLETDEVFILVEGKCILFLAEVEDNTIVKIHAVDMEPYKLYNVRKGVYHSHTLTKDAHVIIVENQDTALENSARVSLRDRDVKELCKFTQELWGD